MCGDTFASELGSVLGNSTRVFHVVKLKWVPKGTNGGISFFGTLASFYGGLFVGLAYYVTLKVCLFFGGNFDNLGEPLPCFSFRWVIQDFYVINS